MLPTFTLFFSITGRFSSNDFVVFDNWSQNEWGKSFCFANQFQIFTRSQSMEVMTICHRTLNYRIIEKEVQTGANHYFALLSMCYSVRCVSQNVLCLINAIHLIPLYNGLTFIFKETPFFSSQTNRLSIRWKSSFDFSVNLIIFIRSSTFFDIVSYFLPTKVWKVFSEKIKVLLVNFNWSNRNDFEFELRERIEVSSWIKLFQKTIPTRQNKRKINAEDLYFQTKY